MQRSRDGLEKSVQYFEQAVAKDPSYAAAYASLADAYNLITFYGYDPSMKDVSQAKIAADHALQLDDSMAAAHAALAYTAFMWGGDWTTAEHEFKRAVELDDNYVPAHQWYALYLAATGRTGEALAEMREAQQLDPLSPSVHAGSGMWPTLRATMPGYPAGPGSSAPQSELHGRPCGAGMGLYTTEEVSRGDCGAGDRGETFGGCFGLPLRAGQNVCPVGKIAGSAEDGC